MFGIAARVPELLWWRTPRAAPRSENQQEMSERGEEPSTFRQGVAFSPQPGACCLPVGMSNESRVQQAIEVMSNKNDGVMLVKINLPSSEQSDEQNVGPNDVPPSIIIPIMWTKRSRPMTPIRSLNQNGRIRGISSLSDTDNNFHLNGSPEKPNVSTVDQISIPDTSIHPDNDNIGHGSTGSFSAHAHRPDDEDDLCVVCMDRLANLQLMPCAHSRFCRRCIVETICTWTKASPPSCPLCRSPFDVMTLLS
mmetsp:Transcript_55614/g.146740  ORF Transcript_55614/g.146740 Transcript_55614/m.146740 type:complete len:251 (-) Transcript_55614:173-925(-)